MIRASPWRSRLRACLKCGSRRFLRRMEIEAGEALFLVGDDEESLTKQGKGTKLETPHVVTYHPSNRLTRLAVAAPLANTPAPPWRSAGVGKLFHRGRVCGILPPMTTSLRFMLLAAACGLTLCHALSVAAQSPPMPLVTNDESG